MPAKYSVQQCQRFRLQHAANEAFAVHEQQAKRGLDIDHLGSSPLGYFHLRLSINGRCWLKIGNRQWGAMLRDTSRHVGSTRKNARFMTWAWNKIQPKKPPLRPRLRVYAIGQGWHEGKTTCSADPTANSGRGRNWD